MTQLHENIVGIDAAIFMHPTTWKASGHVDNFSDPMIDNRDSKKRYRVDHLIEAKTDQLKEKVLKSNRFAAKLAAETLESELATLFRLIEEEAKQESFCKDFLACIDEADKVDVRSNRYDLPSQFS